LEPDAQLIQSCLRGEGRSWEELVHRHTQRVYGMCYRFTNNATAAEDLTQEVFLRVYRTLATYRAEFGAFPTWLTSVTRNLLVDHYRRTKRDRITDSIEDVMPQIEEKPSPAHTPDRAALVAELSGQLQAGLARLSPDLREAVILRDLQGLEYSEIQAVLKVAEGTVKSRINRGRIELARVLRDMGVGPA
jgi:RNA polymerase sigma-70 factor (ECF subfamily)